MAGPNRDQSTASGAETREISLLSFSLIDTRGPSAQALTVGLLLSLGWFGVAWLGMSRDEVPLSGVQSGNRSEARLANGAPVGEPPQRGNGTPRLGNAAQPPPATGSRDQIVSSAPIAKISTPFKIEAHSASHTPMAMTGAPAETEDSMA
jgi:hypothetical protein